MQLNKALWLLAPAIWLAVMATGFYVLVDYETTPGARGTAPSHWPADSSVPRDPERLTLVMLAHPRCPCTRASVGELAEIMAKHGDRISAHVVFFKPEHGGKEWEDTELYRQVEAIPGVQVHVDE